MASELNRAEPRTGWNRTLHVLRRWPLIPLGVILLIIVGAVFAPLLTDHNPRLGDLRDRAMPPMWMENGSGKYPLGTDNVGRDILTRIIHGTRISLLIVVIVLSTGTMLGTTLGLIAGYLGGNIDEVLMRVVDLTLAMPFILVALAVATIFGQSLALIAILLIVFTWGGFARQTRGLTLTLKTIDHVALARVAGASTPRILYRHILPGVFSTVLVIASLQVGGLVLTEATLGFLGVGVPPPTPAWGRMVADGRDYLGTAWWISTFPGIAIFATVFSINFLGDWLRDRFDPRLRQL